MPEMLLLDHIPNSSFRGLDSERPNSWPGRNAAKIAIKRGCRFVSPTLVFPNISPAYFPKDNTVSFGALFTPALPLALRSINSDLDIVHQIKNLNHVSGLFHYYFGDMIDAREKKVIYDFKSGEILRTLWDPNYSLIVKP